MGVFGTSGRRIGLLALSAAIVVGGGLSIAAAATGSNAMHKGHGVNEFGMTQAFLKGRSLSFTYTKGFYCDTSVKTASSSGCEGGQNFRKPPAKDFDPLFITVPLGFTQPMNMLDCPNNLICVDHPGTIGLGRLEKALKPLYPQYSDKQLSQILMNFAVPGHDHYITTANGGKPEWWHVVIVGVTSQKVYNDIRAHKSYAYIHHLMTTKNKNVVGPIQTNMFLFFGAH